MTASSSVPNPNNGSGPRPTDWRIPYYFVAFFVVLALVNMVFVYLAVSTYTGVVTKQSYEKGLDYNHTIDAFEQQQHLGWQTNIVLEENTRVVLSVTDRDGVPLDAAEVSVLITRPTQEGYDATVVLEKQAPGTYSKEVDFPMPGQWDVTASIVWQTHQYQQRKRLIVK